MNSICFKCGRHYNDEEKEILPRVLCAKCEVEE